MDKINIITIPIKNYNEYLIKSEKIHKIFYYNNTTCKIRYIKDKEKILIFFKDQGLNTNKALKELFDYDIPKELITDDYSIDFNMKTC